MKKILLLVFVLLSCDSNPCDSSVKGTLYLENLDGCGWLIKLENGTVVQPINLEEFTGVEPKETTVYISYTKEDSMGICMKGDMVKLTCLHSIK